MGRKLAVRSALRRAAVMARQIEHIDRTEGFGAAPDLNIANKRIRL